ncbi:hypothetical protein CXF74_19465 [Psychromonas sp. Urea-02u-13]|nr:hypothetical protein CXF74_19465 [Psychromonas sp. Urea-02u-13]
MRASSSLAPGTILKKPASSWFFYACNKIIFDAQISASFIACEFLYRFGMILERPRIYTRPFFLPKIKHAQNTKICAPLMACELKSRSGHHIKETSFLAGFFMPVIKHA